MKVKDIYSKIVENNGGGMITLRLDKKSQVGRKKSQPSRILIVRCLRAIAGKQQKYLLVTPVDKKKSEPFSVGSGTKVIDYKLRKGGNGAKDCNLPSHNNHS